MLARDPVGGTLRNRVEADPPVVMMAARTGPRIVGSALQLPRPTVVMGVGGHEHHADVKQQHRDDHCAECCVPGRLRAVAGPTARLPG